MIWLSKMLNQNNLVIQFEVSAFLACLYKKQSKHTTPLYKLTKMLKAVFITKRCTLLIPINERSTDVFKQTFQWKVLVGKSAPKSVEKIWNRKLNSLFFIHALSQKILLLGLNMYLIRPQVYIFYLKPFLYVIHI